MIGIQTALNPDGYLLEIEGTHVNPWASDSDVSEHLEGIMTDLVRAALSIPEGVPLTLHIKAEDHNGCESAVTHHTHLAPVASLGNWRRARRRKFPPTG
ncbi:hypothetical protein [Kitasatospora sp. NPDC094011]|uniref:hypothetical protein n=1 Tax=Kitasatospora sp. NPDC094011 TaxID=3364090 RepID=UPI00380B025E